MSGCSRGGGRIAALPRPLSFKGRMSFLAVAFATLACLAAGVPPAFGDTSSVAVTATVITRSNCRFDTRRSTLDFGALDPAVAADVNAVATVGYVCRGSARVAAFVFTDDNGRNPSGPGARRMRRAAAPEFLPYSLVFSPPSGTVPRNIRRTLTISGTVRWADFRDATAGVYRDSVIVSILP